MEDSFSGDGGREKAARYSRKKSDSVAEIGDLPAVVDPERKAACRTDLHLFLTTYFPNSTGLKPFSEDHRQMIASLQRCVLFGGRMIRAVYRGFAKTTIGENAVIWAALYGHRLLIPLVGADKDAADNNLDSIKSEFESNDLLAEDFPEACFPIRALEGKSQRAGSQTYRGKLTNIEFSAEQIVLANIEGSDCAGVCIRPTSIESYNRGMKHKMPDGRQIRPSFVFIDDPQTDGSAATPGQVQKRLNKISRTILKSAGHTEEMAVYIAATVIEQDDLVEQLLDPVKHPEWDGKRVPMVKSWSANHESLWLEQYSKIRHGWDRANPDDRRRAMRAATQYYADNREEMDRGCAVSWDHCYNADGDDDAEISAIQHAYNMLVDDGPEVFAAECQNEPAGRVNKQVNVVRPDDVIVRGVGCERGAAPVWADHLTAFVDVHDHILWWTVMAFAKNFTSQIVDYGAWPDQRRSYFTKSDAKKTMQVAEPGVGLDAQIRAGLGGLAEHLLEGTWRREGGVDMSIDLMLVDEGYLTPVVYEFCRRSKYRARMMPAKGRAIGASGKPFEEYEKRAGEVLGLHWRRSAVSNNSIRHIVHDPNFWKTFVWSRLTTGVGDIGAMTLFKGDATTHRMMADHMAASEYPVEVEARGRKVNEWKHIPGRDNEGLDCVVGCCVAASALGCSVGAYKTKRASTKKRRVSGSWA